MNFVCIFFFTFFLAFSDEATVVEFHATSKADETSVVLNEMDSVELLCVVDSYPNSTINITKSGIVLQHRTNSYQSVFHLENAKCSDGGTYVCRSLNEHLTANQPSSKSLQVYVTCKFLFKYHHVLKQLLRNVLNIKHKQKNTCKIIYE